MKNEKYLIGMLTILLTLGLVIGGCASGATTTTSESRVPATEGTLDSLLRIAPSEIQRWDDNNVTIYSFNPAIKDELIQALKNAGFWSTWTGDYTRDWNLDRGILRWCVFPNNNGELQFSEINDTTVYNYGFNFISNRDGILRTIKVNGYDLQGTPLVGLDFQDVNEQFYYGVMAEIDGQTLTLTDWPGTGTVFIYVKPWTPPHNPSGHSLYGFSKDGVNKAPYDIKDEVIILEWSDFILLEDRDWIPG